MPQELFMSATSKARLQNVLPHLDDLFGKAHPSDVPAISAELRAYLARTKAASKVRTYDHHSNAATTTDLPRA